MKHYETYIGKSEWNVSFYYDCRLKDWRSIYRQLRRHGADAKALKMARKLMDQNSPALTFTNYKERLTMVIIFNLH